MSNPNKARSSLFRTESLDAYRQQQMEQVFPTSLNHRWLFGLWGAFFLLALVGMGFWFIEVPIYTQITLQPTIDGSQKYTVQVPAGVSFQAGDQVYLNGDPIAEIVFYQAGTSQIMLDASQDIPGVVYVISTHRRLGSYLPLFGNLF